MIVDVNGVVSGKSDRPKRSTRRKRPKTALVLAGGGVTGVVYEIGVLQALSQYLTGDFTIYDFDIVVGLSAGAIVGSLLVNGITPTQMRGALDGDTTELHTFPKWGVFQPNLTEFAQRAAALPFTLFNNLRRNLAHRTNGSTSYVHILDEILPSAIFSNHRVSDFLRLNLSENGRTNDFRNLEREFYVVATDLDTGERVVFGDTGHDHVPISKAVQASSAIPLFYKPVRIGRRDYVDGAIRKTLHVDIAIEKGAEMIVCINPVVPLRNDIDRRAIPMMGHRGRYISEKGFNYVWWQMLRLLLHSRIPLGFERYHSYHPNVDIVLIEPRQDDYKMFFHNIMDYNARVPVYDHGFESTMKMLSENFDRYSAMFARHGISLHNATTLPPVSKRDHIGTTVRQIRIAQENQSEMVRLRSALEDLDKQIDEA